MTRSGVTTAAAIMTVVLACIGSLPGVASATVPGSQLWAKNYGGVVSYGEDNASALAVSPGGSRVFVTGESTGPTSYYDYATVAYAASTGAKLWTKRYNCRADGWWDAAEALGVSPGGSTVFVTGISAGATSNDVATVAYAASTGTKLWAKRYNGPGNGDDYASSLRVSPGGSKVFVGATSTGTKTLLDYTTVAYDASTGAKLWLRRYDGPGTFYDRSGALGVSPDGSSVFVTGQSGSETNSDYATVAYDAHNGKTLWVRRYNGPGDHADAGTALAVSPDSSVVYVTGQSPGSTSSYDYATLAYDASTGTRLWGKRYNDPHDGGDGASALGLSPDGSEVFVTGGSRGSTSQDYVTVAYDASTGTRLWTSRYNSPADLDEGASSLGVSIDGTNVFVTGSDFVTVAYDAVTGAKLWVRHYYKPDEEDAYASALGVSSRGSKLFVTGRGPGKRSLRDYVTVAYRAA
jgi:hypothetical protein